jgi:antirestriction protein
LEKNTMEQKGNEIGPRIYVASLADYNSGRLHGRWIDADQDAEAIHAAIAAMLTESKEPIAEEWAIHDYENFGGLRLSEYESIDTVAEVASLLDEHGDVFGAVVEHFGGLSSLDEAKRCMEEGYRGAFKSLEDFAFDFVEECYGDSLKSLPEFIRGHLDYEGMARDMELGGDVFTIEHDGEVHVFSSHF